MNKAILMGRLTSDPELRQTQNGKDVVSFTIAVNRRFQKEETDFIRCVAWNKTAEFIHRYFFKGSMISVVGSIQTRTWEGQDGKKAYATEVVADEAYFTGGKTVNVDTKTENKDGGELPDLDFGDFAEYTKDEDCPF